MYSEMLLKKAKKSCKKSLEIKNKALPLHPQLRDIEYRS